MTLPSGAVRVPEYVHWRRFDSELVLVDLKGGEYYGLNDVAADAFERLARGQATSEVVVSLLELYEVKPAELQKDVDDLVGVLIGLGLLVADTAT
jgi:hypothetical protein